MTRLEVTTPDALPDETGAEAALRPSRLDEFVGQAQVKASLQIAIDAATGRRRAARPHALLRPARPRQDHARDAHGAGDGRAAPHHLRAGAREAGRPGRAAHHACGPGDILFIDEIHRLRPTLEEFLYPAMEDFRVDVRIADGPNAQTIPMTLERFTLIGATTRFGLLTPPMRARFGMVERLNFYPAEDLQQIVDPVGRHPRRADRRATAPREIARRSRGTPRVANRLLRRVRDYAQVRADGRITGAVAGEALARLNVDEFGLDDMDARILTTIIEKFGGGPVGLGTVAVAVGEDAGTLRGGVRAVPHPAGLPRADAARPRAPPRCAYRRFGITPPRRAGDDL